LPSEVKQRLFARCIALCLKPQLAIEDGADPVIEAAGWRLAIPFADYWRPTAANYWGRVKKAHGIAIGSEILGERWARDHAGDKKPELAAALETAFDPAKSTACIGLDRAARESAAAWLPPGMAYADPAANNPSTDPQWDEAAPLAGDPDDGKPTEIDLPPTELPAFQTEDEPIGIALNGASAS
jgi:ParB family chromosome partitioning protein